MPNNQINKDIKELKMQFLISEYGKLRDEILQSINNQNQILLLAMGSASIAIPILIGQSDTIATPILASLLYTLSIIYSVLTMNYVHTGYTVGTISGYIYEQIEPAVNQLIHSNTEKQIAFWESYIRKERGNFFSFFISSISPTASLLIIFIASLASLISAQYVLLIPAIQTQQQGFALQFTIASLVPLSFFAWGCFVFSAVASVSLIIYSLLKNKWAVKP